MQKKNTPGNQNSLMYIDIRTQFKHFLNGVSAIPSTIQTARKPA